MLAIGLDFVEAGFKQLEVVFLLRHIPALADRAFRMDSETIPRRSASACTRHPGRIARPTMTEEPRWPIAGSFCWSINRSSWNFFPAWRRIGRKGTPIFLEPAFCRGVEELGAVLSDRMPNRRRKTFVLELSHAAALVPQFLEKSPAFSRGRGGV